jgi:hypothetical protein
VSETLYGPWAMSIVSREAWYDQRVVISGSDSADGAYPGIVGAPVVEITGAEWTLTMEWNDNASSGWQPSATRRAARYTVNEGLVIEIGADDNFPHLRDGDFDDVVVGFVSRDPAHTPLHPIVNPYEFTLGKDVKIEDDRHRQPDTPDDKRDDDRKPEK